MIVLFDTAPHSINSLIDPAKLQKLKLPPYPLVAIGWPEDDFRQMYHRLFKPHIRSTDIALSFWSNHQGKGIEVALLKTIPNKSGRVIRFYMTHRAVRMDGEYATRFEERIGEFEHAQVAIGVSTPDGSGILVPIKTWHVNIPSVVHGELDRQVRHRFDEVMEGAIRSGHEVGDPTKTKFFPD